MDIKKKIRSKLPPVLLHNIRKMRHYPASIQFLIGSKTFIKTGNHKKIASLKNAHQGKRCFIIGSGPSINKMDLSPLKSEITFGHNAFYLIADRLGFLPTYYVIEDPLPAEDNSTEINKLVGTTKIFPQDLKYCLKKDEKTVYVNFNRYFSYYPQPNFPQFSEDMLKCVFWGGTVAYMSLQLAYYMGIREVYLIGVDLSYKVPENEVDPVITSETDDPNHFHPDYFGAGKRWHQPMVERMKHSFEYAAKFYQQNDGIVHNATVGGNLDTLPRVDYKTLFTTS